MRKRLKINDILLVCKKKNYEYQLSLFLKKLEDEKEKKELNTSFGIYYMKYNFSSPGTHNTLHETLASNINRRYHWSIIVDVSIGSMVVV